MIQIKDQKIIINEKETVLFGGELHYFRVPVSEWKFRLRQMKEAGMNMVSTYIPWKFHEQEEGNIDLTGKTRPEKNVKAFLKLVEEEKMYCLVRPGPYVMAEIIDHGVPSWFIDRYPEAVAKTRNEKNHPTRVVSYMHPIFLEKTRKWYEAVCDIIRPFQITNGGPVILFQLDNEVGMFHWVTNTPDFNSETLKLFKTYLEEKYTEHEFEAEFQVPIQQINLVTETLVKNPEKSNAHAIRNEFSHFLRQHYREFVEYLKQLADKNEINVPYVVNIHGFHTIDLLKRGTMYPIGISQLLETAKIENVLMAGDYYIGNIEYDNYIDIVLANAFTKAIQWKEQPLFSAEFQGGSIHDKPRLQPTTFDLTTRLCIADGMNGVNYYMFVSGENYENIGIHGKRHDWQAPLTAFGEKRPHYEVIKHLGQLLKVHENQLIETKPQADTVLGFYPDYFMTDFYDEHTKNMISTITNERDAFLYNGIAKGLRVNNFIFDAYNLLDEEELNPEKKPTLWVFSTKWMDKKVQRKLIRYIEDGGTLILFPHIPENTMKNEPCTILKDYIGANIIGQIDNGFATVGNIENVSIPKAEIYADCEGAFAWLEDESKSIIAFEKTINKGKVIVFGIGLEIDFEYKRTIITDLANRAGIKSRFQLTEDLDVNVRTHPDGRKYLFLNNFDEYTKWTKISYMDESWFDGKVLKIPSKSGLMLPLDVNLTEDLRIIYGTGEIMNLDVNLDKLTVTIRVVQDEEEFIFNSAKWMPRLTQNNIQIEKLAKDNYRVKIKSHRQFEKIIFTPVIINN